MAQKGLVCALAATMASVGTLLQGCISLAGSPSGPALNVYGGNLSTCSQRGMAMTGFTRDGHCTDLGNDDAGSHHICIKMKSDFCTVTQQPNWCGESMPCMGQAGVCPIGNWCVCQWAFATYIQMAGGCDSIVDLVCDATNLAALKAYEQSSAQEHINALACIRKRCGLQAAASPKQLVS